jgi:hypothetical protein
MNSGDKDWLSFGAGLLILRNAWGMVDVGMIAKLPPESGFENGLRHWSSLQELPAQNLPDRIKKAGCSESVHSRHSRHTPGTLKTALLRGSTTDLQWYRVYGKLYGSRSLTQAEEGMRRGVQGESTEVLSPCVLTNID